MICKYCNETMEFDSNEGIGHTAKFITMNVLCVNQVLLLMRMEKKIIGFMEGNKSGNQRNFNYY